MQRIIATFHPQAWSDGKRTDVEPLGEGSFDVTDFLCDLGEEPARRIKDYDDSSDDLASLPIAPEWIRSWPGPFFVTVEQSINEYFKFADVAWDWV
jgi:hypothetical protein